MVIQVLGRIESVENGKARVSYLGERGKDRIFTVPLNFLEEEGIAGRVGEEFLLLYENSRNRSSWRYEPLTDKVERT